MTLSVRLTPAPERDILLAAGWYLEDAPAMVASFEAELDGTFQRIADRPEMYQMVEASVHRATVPRFPFSVFYRILPDRIEVVGILHQSRDPRDWQRRA